MTLSVPVSVTRPADASSGEAGDALAVLETRSMEAMELLGKAKDALSSMGEKIFQEGCT